MTTVTTQYGDATTTTVTTTTTTMAAPVSSEADSNTKMLGIIELAIGGVCAILALSTIIFSWVYLDARLDIAPIDKANEQCKAALGTKYMEQICTAVTCPGILAGCTTDTGTGEARFCGVKFGGNPATDGECYYCPYKRGTAKPGQNYLSGEDTEQCSTATMIDGCKNHCVKTLGTGSAATACVNTCPDNGSNENVQACRGRNFKEGGNVYESKRTCPGYSYPSFDYTSNTEIPYTGDKSLLVCGRPMYTSVCFQWGASRTDPNTIDTSPLALLKNWKYGGGIPSTVAASLALIIAIPAMLNGFFAMSSNESGVKGTAGLGIGFSIIGFCTSTTCLIVVCVMAGVSRAIDYIFAIFNGFEADSTSGGTCPMGGACYDSVLYQQQLSTVVSYYFTVLSFLVGFLFALSLLQTIMSIVVCCAYKRKGAL